MSNDLDDRIAYLKQQRQADGAAQAQKAAELIQAIDELQGIVRETAFKSATVEAKMQLVETQMDELENRVKRTRFLLVGGIVVAISLCILIIVASFWLGSNFRSTAQAEGDTLRIVSAWREDSTNYRLNSGMMLLRNT